jgi:hypothetical protein
MIPPEINSPIRRTTIMGDDNSNDPRLHLNLLEERREIAAIREATYKKEMEKILQCQSQGEKVQSRRLGIAKQ